MFPHSTEVAGLKTTKCGDNRYYNNIFVGGVKEERFSKSGLGIYANAEFPMFVDGNVYVNGARVFESEENKLALTEDMKIQIKEEQNEVFISMNWIESITKMKNQVISSEQLGKALVSNQDFTKPDGSPVTIDYDYLGKKRDNRNPTAGPFENPGKGKISLKVWERK